MMMGRAIRSTPRMSTSFRSTWGTLSSDTVTPPKKGMTSRRGLRVMRASA